VAAYEQPGVEHEQEFESRFEATLALLLVIVLQMLLAGVSLGRDWRLAGLHGWIWLIPVAIELALLLPLALAAPRRRLEQMGVRRRFALVLTIAVMVVNVAALILLIASLLTAHEKSGGELLLKAVTVWGTNVIIFGLLFWELDRGGPARRRLPDPPPRDLQFPQDENPSLAAPGWHPRLLDYVYVSFTNALAFSPTDSMPLSQRFKALMLGESLVSAITVLLAAARAVNIIR
jgi:uncharacterized membrane protein